MIDVLKRLADLDSKNPNVIYENSPITPGGFSNQSKPGHDGHQDLDQPDIHGMLEEPAVLVPDAGKNPESTGPANINISAGSGEEVSNMLATIMQLAGVKPVTDNDMGVEPHGAVLTAEPSMSGTPPMAEPEDGDDMRDMISAVDKLNAAEKPADEKTPDDSEEETDESVDALRINSNSGNSPTKQNPFNPEEFANHENSPMGGDVPKDHDHRSRVRNQPTATMEEQLMADYKQFVVENEIAPSQHVPIGQQMANDGITYSPEKEKEIIGLMVQYMKKDGMSPKSIRYYLNYDEDYIPDQLSYLPRSNRAEQGVAEGSEHNVGGISHSIIKHPGGKHQVVVKHGDKVAHTSLHNSEEDAKKSLASQIAHSKKMLKVDEQGVAEAGGYNPNAIAGKNWEREKSTEMDFRNKERNAGLEPQGTPDTPYGNNIEGPARSIYWYAVPKDKEEKAQQLAKFGNDQFQQSGGEEGFGFTKAKDGMWMLKIFNDPLARGIIDSYFGQGQKGDSRGPHQRSM